MLGFSEFSLKVLWWFTRKAKMNHTKFASQVTGPCDNGAYIVHNLAAEVGSGPQRMEVNSALFYLPQHVSARPRFVAMVLEVVGALLRKAAPGCTELLVVQGLG